MNQPIEQRFAKLEQRIDNLERAESEWSFTARDITYKTDLAQGFMRQLHSDMQEIKLDTHHIKGDIQQLSADSAEMKGKLDLILQLLQPRQE